MRILCLGALVLLAPSVPAGAQSAETPGFGEVVLAIGCPTSPCRFQQGEVIQLKLTFTAAKAGYGLRDGVQVGDGLALRQSGLDWFTAAPSGCVGDPLEGSTVGMNPSGIFGMPPLLPGKPFSLSIELNQWIRFGCPGKYQVTAQSSRAFGGAYAAAASQRQLTLVSNPMDIEIVPADGQWQKAQLARILPELPAPGAEYSAFAKAAVRALGYLGSDDALREIRKRISDGPFTADFRYRNTWYVLDWEMARLELLRHAALPGRQ